MDLHSSGHSSPVGLQATLNVAMELENKLKSEMDDSFGRLQQQTHVCVTGSGRHASLNGSNDDEEEDEDDDDHEKRTLIKNFDGSPLTNKGRQDDLKKDVLNNSDALESEMMEDDDDDSMGRSSPGSYPDLSPSIDNSKEGTEDMDDEFDTPMRKYGGSIARNRLQQNDGSSQAFGVSGGRPGSSEGDYYDGAISNENSHLYNHIGRPDSESPNVENGGSDKFYPCHLCSFTATSKCHFNSHMNTHYNHKCNHCDYTSRTEGRLKRHMKDFHSDLPPEAYSSSRVLKGDRDGSHGDSNGNSQGKIKTYRCKQCNFTATVKAIFWEHTKSHIKAEKLLTCPKCPFVTEYKHHLEYHLRNHFGSKPFKCPKCNYSCVNKSMLNSHMKSHSNVYQYRCNDCTYATKYCHSLKLHLRKYAHKPAVVLNPDGTPNPIPVIDVYGTRRGPRQKKSQPSEDQKLFCNGGSNTNGGGTIPFSPIPMPVNGALSPATVIPFFYPGASGPMPNGFHSGIDSLLRPGNMDKSPNGGPPPQPPPPPPPPPSHINNNSNHSSSNGTNGSAAGESETIENEKVQHHSKNTAIKCNLCPFVTDHRETFSKHMILHAAAENQDLCNLYGINSESLVMEPNQHQQQQLNATAMAAMVAALGLSGTSRNDVHRQSIPISMASSPGNYDVMVPNGNFRSSPNAANNNKVKSNNIEEETASLNGGNLSVPHITNPLDHLRMFSEQAHIQPFSSTRDFTPQHYSSPNLANYMLESSPNAAEKSSASSYSPGSNSQKASHKSKASKEGAISTRNRSPHQGETMNVTVGLGPLDLSNTKNGSSVQRVGSNYSQLQMFPQHHSPRFLSPVLTAQQSQAAVSSGAYESLQVNTDGMPCVQQPDLISPSNQTKHRRKGKAFKLDRICMKLQKDYSYSDPPSNEFVAEDSIGDGDLRPRSSEETVTDVVEIDFKGVDIKEEVDYQSESDCRLQQSQQPIKEVETNVSVTNGGKKSLLISKAANKSLEKSTEFKKSPPSLKNATVVDLIEGEEDENEVFGKNGYDWKEAYKCHYCDMAFKDCVMYTVHMGYHGFKDPFKCNMCGQQTKDKVAFFLHIARTAHL